MGKNGPSKKVINYIIDHKLWSKGQYGNRVNSIFYLIGFHKKWIQVFSKQGNFCGKVYFEDFSPYFMCLCTIQILHTRRIYILYVQNMIRISFYTSNRKRLSEKKNLGLD